MNNGRANKWYAIYKFVSVKRLELNLGDDISNNIFFSFITMATCLVIDK